MLQPDNEQTVVLHGEQATIQAIIGLASNSRHMLHVCADSLAPSVSIGVKELKDAMVAMHARGVKYQYITEVTKDNIEYCQELQKYAELRHLDGIKGNFAVNEGEYLATAVVPREAAPVPEVIHSTVKSIVEQHEYLFQTLWRKSIPAEQRISEIQQGVEQEQFEVIYDTEKASELILQLSRSAKREVLFRLPNSKSLLRMENLGVLDTLKAAARNGAEVRIIVPVSQLNSAIVENLVSEPGVKVLDAAEAQSGIMIIDRSHFLSSELVHPASEMYSDAIGVSVYSNSRRSISSLVSFFDSLWNQSELYKQLEAQQQAEKKFINIAAHELRTPVQPIIGRVELLKMELDSGKLDIDSAKNALEMIARNAERLQRLTENLLTVSRVERSLLHLNRTEFELSSVIGDIVNDSVHQVAASAKSLTVVYEPKEKIVINADRDKISQVLYNLLGNAIKFTDEGTVEVTASRAENPSRVVVTIRDTGPGIDPSMFPQLFEIFASKAVGETSTQSGTGVGLYVAKHIVEAHGGTLSASNNADGKGATFSFTIPY
ncbi:MAG: HAMP domain-containing sensor histidine kinase [Nitrososphaera sp.]